ncbi:butyrate kinase [Youngiibacter multivorans]|uniref:Probable butyrate kinase n=1 Tax=Youngiibacter multivorans TaxID=937251 RepID=A0ABS4G3D8_9CLOT|nr:butyrate kinase [Youngiibacter multivorans]MBP1919059.1 butyrate kinase [Youngiibacter multivorans]
MKYVLVINPGSTSTKVAIFSSESVALYSDIIEHDPGELSGFGHISEQLPLRREAISSWIRGKGLSKDDFIAIVGRGGIVRPIRCGTYLVDDALFGDLKDAKITEHASNLGGIIAKEMADSAGINAYIVDPVSCDEMNELARVTGFPGIERGSLAHYLNIKAVVRKVCRDKGYDFSSDNFVVAHLGSGFSIGPVEAGRLTDVNNANEGGPLMPERSGTLPLSGVVKLAYSGKYEEKELLRLLQRKSGLLAHLGTNDARKVEKMIDEGDENAKLIYDAMGYHVAKEIGAAAAALKGKVKCIILTGGLAYSAYMTSLISSYVGFLAPVVVVPGEDEMRALFEGAKRVLDGEETPLSYEEEIIG